MPEMVEVTKDQAATAALAEALWNDPETRGEFQRTIKKKFPKVPIPEVDVPEQYLKQIQPQLDEVKKLRGEIETERRTEQIERAWQTAGVTPDERASIEKLMADQLIGDIATGVKMYRYEQQAQAAATPRMGPAPFELPHKTYKGILENRQQWARETALQALDDIRSGRVPAV